jgi:hypothetical protein
MIPQKMKMKLMGRSPQMRLSVARPLVSEASQSSARARIWGPYGPEILVYTYLYIFKHIYSYLYIFYVDSDIRYCYNLYMFQMSLIYQV